jgi:hypothetical protein
VMKYASQGMGHGHYDRLGLLYYDQGQEVLQDYGSARFINVETKNGGRYLPENSSWSKQTIAHNTVAVDGRSHFDGKLDRAEEFPGQRRLFDYADPTCQVMSATSDQIAPGVRMQRTVMLVRDDRFPSPAVIDVIRLTADAPHQYDLPFYYQGQLVNAAPFPAAQTRARLPLGERNGYQHLWVEATATARGTVQWTWLLGGRYYSVISGADTGMEAFFVRIGAGDPGFNLRTEPAVILRRRASSCVFASVIEPHGAFDPVDEISHNARPSISEVRVVADSDEGTVVEIGGADALRWHVQIANGTPSATALHTVSQGGVQYSWKGNAALVRDVR